MESKVALKVSVDLKNGGGKIASAMHGTFVATDHSIDTVLWEILCFLCFDAHP